MRARPVEPEAPQASAPVRPLLAAGRAAAAAKQWPASLEAMDRARAAARAAGDAAGEALAERGRAAALSNLDRQEDAAEACRAAAAAWARAGDGPGQVEALLVAALQEESRRPEAARGLFAQALAVARAETKRPLAAADALDTLALGMYQLGLLAPARDCWQVAVTLHDRAAPDTPIEARILSNLGAVLSRLGDAEGARAPLQRALALQGKQAPGSMELARTLNNMGLLAEQQRDLTTARRCFERALAIKEQRAPGSREVTWARLNLGELLYSMGELPRARQLFRQALAREEQRAPHSVEVADCLKRLGVVAYRQGASAEARADYQRALAIRAALPPDPRAQADLLDNLGLVATQQGDLDAAAEYHRQALAVYEKVAPDSLDLAYCLNNLGNVAWLRDDRTAAKAYYKRSLALKEKLAPGSLDVASALNNLSDLALGQGDLATAEADQRRALALRERLAPESLEVATSRFNLAAIQEQQGRRAAAEADYHRAAAIQERLASGSLALADSLSRLARLHAERGEWAAAEPLARRAAVIGRRQAAGVTGDEALQAFGAANTSYAAILARIQLHRGQAEAAFLTVEEGRAQALLRIVSERGLDTREAPAALRAAYRAARSARDAAEQAASEASSAEALARRALAAAQETAAGAGALARLQAELADAARHSEAARAAATRARLQVDTLWADLIRHSPRTFPPPLTLARAARALPPGTLYLGYTLQSKPPLLFLLRARVRARRAEVTAYPLALTPAALQSSIRAFREAVTEPLAGVEAATQAGRALFQSLVPPAARPRVRVASRLLIAPDGPLWGVPFAALVINPAGPPTYLGADRSIRFTPSLGLLVEGRRQTVDGRRWTVDRGWQAGDGGRKKQGARQPAASALVVGDPAFAPPSPDLNLDLNPVPPPLPATAEEARQIARLYRVTPLLGRQASEGAVRQRISSARIVHLATHGFFLPARAMSSGLRFSVPRGTPRPEDDGVLQAWEIYSQLHLRAELVVLSACETGRGAEVPSEGIIGLTRALQYAGAQAVLASQWAVADASTARLMLAFHQRLQRGIPADEALRQAMARLRTDPRTAHPYYWAPFFLIGAPAASGSTGPAPRRRGR